MGDSDSNKKYLYLTLEAGGMVAIYFITLLVPLMVNIVRYVCSQKRYKVGLVSTFYLLAFTLVSARIIAYTSLVITYQTDYSLGLVGSSGLLVASWSKFSLYMFQCVSMQSFILRLKSSVSIVTENRSNTSIVESRDGHLKCWYTIATFLSVCMMALYGFLIYWLFWQSNGSSAKIEPLSEKFSIATFSVILGGLAF